MCLEKVYIYVGTHYLCCKRHNSTIKSFFILFREKLPGTDWTLVTTNDGKKYYYDAKNKVVCV